MTDELKKLKDRLDKAKEAEQSIVDKYSTNYKEWQKACNKVNRLRCKYNSEVAKHNYLNGAVAPGSSIVI